MDRKEKLLREFINSLGDDLTKMLYKQLNEKLAEHNQSLVTMHDDKENQLQEIKVYYNY
jgi:hypothetical protein